LTAPRHFADIIAQFSYFNQIESLLVSNQALEELFATKLSKQTSYQIQVLSVRQFELNSHCHKFSCRIFPDIYTRSNNSINVRVTFGYIF